MYSGRALTSHQARAGSELPSSTGRCFLRKKKVCQALCRPCNCSPPRPPRPQRRGYGGLAGLRPGLGPPGSPLHPGSQTPLEARHRLPRNPPDTSGPHGFQEPPPPRRGPGVHVLGCTSGPGAGVAASEPRS